ncbi:MAG: FAD-dependent oxidoreductase [Acidobacteria bacterium]|nr:MAG: FAD-dependent oxidoreductase [Acidobacteriota bacterium]REK04278.1 MAG: FAD-dependent oxidoreductase [Acidobacteriota bacterium]
MSKRVLILGGGVAGLTAAHELLERGYRVCVLERQSIAGGKARSVWHEGLPAEHGFRFFPGFYKHLPDTMRRTPVGSGRSAFDHLEWSRLDRLAFMDGSRILTPPSFPRSLRMLWLSSSIPFRLLRKGLPLRDLLFFGGKLWRIVTSSFERRAGEYEKIGWMQFVQADERSQQYRDLLAVGPTRILVASKAEEANTKTLANVSMQLIFNTITPGETSDRLLDGPTNEVWIDRWLEDLRGKGLDYEFDQEVTRLVVEEGAIAGVEVGGPDGAARRLEADYYLSALPVEVMGRLASDELIAADPHLAGLRELRHHVNWMNGVQFYLAEDVRLNPGHIIVSGSPWALTGLSQQQFWSDYSLAEESDGRVHGCLSVDISDWNTPGLNGRRARDCSRQEVVEQVWAQLQQALPELRGIEYVSAFLDDDIVQAEDNPHHEINLEPLLVNRADSWRLRPEAWTALPNLFLASDYVRTYSDLACMEAANEAARRAVNALLERDGSDAERCEIFPLREWWLFAPLKWLDRRRYERGKPWSWLPLP